MTDKDIEITTTALLKSIIEGGAPQHQWEPLLRQAVSLWVQTVNYWKGTRGEVAK